MKTWIKDTAYVYEFILKTKQIKRIITINYIWRRCKFQFTLLFLRKIIKIGEGVLQIMHLTESFCCKIKSLNCHEMYN